MEQDYRGQLDFTNLCRLWKNHKELFQMVDFKDGKHALLKTSFSARQQPDEHGNTHYLKASCKKAEQKEGVNYYISSGFKPFKQQDSQQATQADSPDGTGQGSDDLPF